MLVDNFTNPLFWLVFKNKRALIGIEDIKKDNWIKVLRLKIYNKDGGCLIFCLFFMYNRPGNIGL